ncbi:MAG: AAA family ATPase [Elusimicrobia bacterium]|nr:AAA family ATPase [Elusimicrobiota bacterium]
MKRHFERLIELIAMEREAEREENRLELERMSAPEREALGRTVSKLSVESLETAEGRYPVLTLTRARRGEALSPFHALDQGDCVRVSFPPGADPPSSFGTIERLEADRAAVAMDGRMPEKLPPGKLTLDLVGSEATYRRMRRALSEIAEAEGNWPARFRDILCGEARAEADKPAPLDFLDQSLNERQRRAVARALAARDAALIHGPPGTGKTTTLVEVIRQAARRGLRVLAAAPSNVAADNILERLLPDMDAGLRMVRLGHPARTLESLRRGNLRLLVAADEQFKQVSELDAQRDRIVKKLARSGRSRFTFDERRAAETEVRRRWREARALERSIERRILASAQVVLSTHGGISRRLLGGEFDLVALDEASQATEPLSWIPLLRGRKAVFAGDSMQLPPTLRSKEAARELGVTLFDRLQSLLPDSMQTLLRVQYRMHRTLMDFPSKEFYGGKLIAHDSVRAHLACHLSGVQETDLTSAPLVFVDTAGTGYDERLNEFLQSRENDGEARLAAMILRQLLDSGMRPQDIAVLSPYAAQVRLLKSMVRAVPAPGQSGARTTRTKHPKCVGLVRPELTTFGCSGRKENDLRVEIGTVDGFQGREKEAVLVSLTRSNERGEVGFLSDTRRMNVTLTRARRLLIVIGDSATIARHPFYRSFLDYAEKAGSHRSAWEWPKFP